DVPAAHEAHGDEQHAAVLARLVDRDDVRLIHAGRGPRFPDEALAEGLVLGQSGGQDLEGDIAVQPGVVGTVDDGHAAPADLLRQLVASDERARGEVTRTAARFLAHSSSTRFPPRSPAAPAAPLGKARRPRQSIKLPDARLFTLPTVQLFSAACRP